MPSISAGKNLFPKLLRGTILLAGLFLTGCASTGDVYSSDLQTNANQFHTELVTLLAPYLRGDTSGNYSANTAKYDKLTILVQQMNLDAQVAQDEATAITVPKIQRDLTQLMQDDKKGELTQEVATEFLQEFQHLLKLILLREQSAEEVEKSLSSTSTQPGGSPTAKNTTVSTSTSTN